MIAGVDRRHQMLAAILDPAHRMIELERQRGDHHLLRREPRLDAEAAADIGRDDADAPLLDAECLGKAEAERVRHLGRAVDHELVEPMVAIGQNRAALERHAGLAVHAIVAPHHDRGLARGRVDVAALHHPLDVEIVAPMLVQQAGRAVHRGGGIDDRRQHLVFDGHGSGDVFGFGAGGGDAGGDRPRRRTGPCRWRAADNPTA